MDHDLPAKGAIDAVNHELAAGFDHRIDVVGAGVAGFVDRRATVFSKSTVTFSGSGMPARSFPALQVPSVEQALTLLNSQWRVGIG